MLCACCPDKLKPGEAMLEEYRKSGKPVPPQVEKMAAWLDKMEDDAGQDVPMVKPGGLNGWRAAAADSSNSGCHLDADSACGVLEYSSSLGRGLTR